MAFETATAGLLSMTNESEVKIRVTDDSGKAIKAVTILAIHALPDQFRQKDISHASKVDLERIIRRYRNSYYFINPAHNIFDGLHYVGLTSSDGSATDTIIPGRVGGKDLHTADVSYAFLKDGYQTGVKNISVDLSGHLLNLSITLVQAPDSGKKNSKVSEIQHAFDDIRFTVEDIRKHLSLSLDQYEKLKQSRKDLVNLSRRAEAEEQIDLAARIWAWIQYMPVIELDDKGRPYRYLLKDARSADGVESLKNAYRLQPASPYIQMEHLLMTGAEASIEMKKAPKDQLAIAQFRKYIDRLDGLIKDSGEEVWPKAYMALAGGYERLGMYEESLSALEAAKKFEPFYLDYEAYEKGIRFRKKSRMR